MQEIYRKWIQSVGAGAKAADLFCVFFHGKSFEEARNFAGARKLAGKHARFFAFRQMGVINLLAFTHC